MPTFKLIADMTITVTVEVEVVAVSLKAAVDYTEENLCINAVCAEDMDNPGNISLRFTKNPAAWSTESVKAYEKEERGCLDCMGSGISRHTQTMPCQTCFGR